jgi:hypothetical protein
VKLQAQKIVELKAAYVDLKRGKCVDLKRGKENVTAGYQRLSEKHKRLVQKVDQEKAELAEAHATELGRVQEELDKETQDYTDYRLNGGTASTIFMVKLKRGA